MQTSDHMLAVVLKGCEHKNQDLKLEDADVGIPVSSWELFYVRCNCKPLCCNLVCTGIEPQRALLTVTPSQRPSCVWTLFTLDHTASCQRYAYAAPVLGLSHSHVFSTSATDQAAKAFLPKRLPRLHVTPQHAGIKGFYACHNWIIDNIDIRNP